MPRIAVIRIATENTTEIRNTEKSYQKYYGKST